MLKKLMIAPYFGGLPPWFDRLLANTNKLRPYGWEFLFFPDREELDRLVMDALGVKVGWGYVRKITDLFPMFGAIFGDYLKGYDYWGYCGLDQVWGRVDKLLPDEELSQYDIWACDADMLCGPCTLFANVHTVNNLFTAAGEWRDVVENTKYYGWDEGGFDKLVKRVGKQRVGYSRRHAYGDPSGLTLDLDGNLNYKGKDIMMFHFNRTKTWPLA